MNILAFAMSPRGSSACVVRDGVVAAAAREEWFTGRKDDDGFPDEAVAYCLEAAGLGVSDIDVVTHPGGSEGVLPTLHSWLAPRTRGLLRMPLIGGGGRSIRQSLRQQAGIAADTSIVSDFHAAAATAFFTSPFSDAAILVMNGGRMDPGYALAVGNGNAIQELGRLPHPAAFGTLYTAFAQRMGYVEPWQEGELADLAILGKPRFAAQIRREMTDCDARGLCRVHEALLGGPGDLNRLHGRLVEFVGGPVRGGYYTPRHMDLARSLQTVLEDALLHAAEYLRRETGLTRLAFAGDVALNAAAVGRLVREGPFDEVWVPPSPADLAVGCALHLWHAVLGHPRLPDRAAAPCYDGPAFADEALESFLQELTVPYRREEPEAMCRRLAEVIAQGALVGWFQGAAAAGPQGLGARCILADPRRRGARDHVNMRVKQRPAFRRLGASVLEEYADEYFKEGDFSGCMGVAVPLTREYSRPLKRSEKRLRGFERLELDRSDLPAVAGADQTVLVHRVSARREPLLHRLIRHFQEITGHPVLANASLGFEHEPVATAPREAYRHFMRTDLHFLVLGPFLLEKAQQPLWEDVAATAGLREEGPA